MPRGNKSILQKLIKTKGRSKVYHNVDDTLTKKEKQTILLIVLGSLIPISIGITIAFLNL